MTKLKIYCFRQKSCKKYVKQDKNQASIPCNIKTLQPKGYKRDLNLGPCVLVTTAPYIGYLTRFYVAIMTSQGSDWHRDKTALLPRHTWFVTLPSTSTNPWFVVNEYSQQHRCQHRTCASNTNCFNPWIVAVFDKINPRAAISQIIH
jgi:hypothetical protein